MLEDELVAFQESGRLNLKVIIKNPPKNWPYLQGEISKKIIEDEAPVAGNFLLTKILRVHFS